ncbi:recombinase family protein [Bradyrhizobium sp. SRL28]|uniref:recombinase family protein n=1 Tax=Bradyrhizobium sp. SRL28 TaxID=2836178 RepID=UPI0035AE6235
MHHRDLVLPRRDRHKDPRCQAATESAVTAILETPPYAGCFVYRDLAKTIPNTGAPPRECSRPETDWWIVVRQKYPANIDWQTFGCRTSCSPGRRCESEELTDPAVMHQS